MRLAKLRLKNIEGEMKKVENAGSVLFGAVWALAIVMYCVYIIYAYAALGMSVNIFILWICISIVFMSFPGCIMALAGIFSTSHRESSENPCKVSLQESGLTLKKVGAQLFLMLNGKVIDHGFDKDKLFSRQNIKNDSI
jgi:hypothetical protein